VLRTAHLGHWYVQLAFAAPAIVVIAYMTRDSLRRRRERRRDPGRRR
jgi:membrane protein implicated in regulation of membrane protease activity